MIVEDQTKVIEFLADPATHGGASVERIETHVSIVFLAGAREPISALFYVSDNGRRLRLDINGAQPETLDVGGRSWAALKIEPRLSDRIERGPLTVTAWVSADARRVPLLVEVEAGFGVVRLELTDYRER